MEMYEIIGIVAAAFVVGLWIGRSTGADQAPVAPPPPPLPPPPGAALAEIKRILDRGDKIEAIKMYRKETGAGLKEAKDAVERLA
jgi:large subunit ribosomal protein L7/L12